MRLSLDLDLDLHRALLSDLCGNLRGAPRIVVVVAFVFALGMSASCAPALAAAPTDPPPSRLPFANVIVRALVDGRASEPLPDLPLLRKAIAAMQQQAGDSGPIVVLAMRLQRFVQQGRCGRVVFGMSQPSSHKAWPGLGGELNICEDGLPPLRVCKDRPNVLVPPDDACGDGALPQDTAEVASAISAAVNRGGLTVEQAKQESLRARETAPRAATPNPPRERP